MQTKVYRKKTIPIAPVFETDPRSLLKGLRGGFSESKTFDMPA